ncbi:hypothetical protein Aph01nite_79440 [Acrocarpospora phusangensis]|uniref:Uncharacterized protein n=1 Tax=Acrocarpospora phusangensis TaxID=1070424 RepID=A0A919QK58_9ACTN|nr:hypothetical protein [Acrocarpospora phusangensis]GIH29634.1 hypothetical protein Aph01nite_79440 [Acrocarpospora phusangensis]
MEAGWHAQGENLLKAVQEWIDQESVQRLWGSVESNLHVTEAGSGAKSFTWTLESVGFLGQVLFTSDGHAEVELVEPENGRSHVERYEVGDGDGLHSVLGTVRDWVVRPDVGRGMTLMDLAHEWLASASLDDVDDYRPFIRSVMVRWVPEFDLVIRRVEAANREYGSGFPVPYSEYMRIIAIQFLSALRGRDMVRVEQFSGLVQELLDSNLEDVREWVDDSILETLAFYKSEISDMLPERLRAEVDIAAPGR